MNVLIGKYNKDAETFKSQEDNRTMEFVDGRITKVIADLSKVEREMEEYKTRNDITFLESDVLMYSEAMKQLQTAILDVESQTYMIDMLDEYIKDPKNRYSVIPSLMTISRGEQVGAISKYNESLVER
ncbi:MAG TPA: tyrosine protein kinase, partial [Porphyromonadaceae bacterium]|nr:tyrosine protein kinase [Porphyromonadaceae bacterium]